MEKNRVKPINTSSEKLLVFIIKRSIIALREEINPLDDNKKIDNILMKSRMYVMYVSKKNKKEKVKVYPSIIKVMGSTRYTRFPPRLIIVL